MKQVCPYCGIRRLGVFVRIFATKSFPIKCPHCSMNLYLKDSVLLNIIVQMFTPMIGIVSAVSLSLKFGINIILSIIIGFIIMALLYITYIMVLRLTATEAVRSPARQTARK